MKLIILIILLSTLTTISNSILYENFSQRFENYIEVGFRQEQGSSFYDKDGNLNISQNRDTTLFQDKPEGLPTQIQGLFTRSRSLIDLRFKYFIIPSLNINGSFHYGIDKVEREENFLDLNGNLISERFFEDQNQELLLPTHLNMEYFITKSNFISSINIGASIPFGDFDILADSSLNGSGMGFYKFGASAAYRGEVSYFELRANYLSTFEPIEDLLQLTLAVDVTKVEFVDLFLRLDYLLNINQIEQNEFAPNLPQTNFSSLDLAGGFTITFDDLKFKVLLRQRLLGSNQIDFRGWGFRAAYTFGNPKKK